MSDNQKLNIDALVDGDSIDSDLRGYFVNVPHDKEALHPARYFEQLFLHKVGSEFTDEKGITSSLGLSDKQFVDFLNERVSVTNDLAEKLEVFSGMPRHFWLQTQSRYDNSHRKPTEN